MKLTSPTQLDVGTLGKLFAQADDVAIHSMRLGPASATYEAVLVYCEGLANSSHVNQFVLPQLRAMFDEIDCPGPAALEQKLLLLLKPVASGDDLAGRFMNLLFSGQLLLVLPEAGQLYALDISDLPNRKPEESSTEVSIKGPRDAFTESLTTNIALIRKRLKSHSLCCEKFIVGKRTHTGTALLYIGDVINPDFIAEARRRLNALDMDGITGIGQLEEALSDRPYSLFPLINYIGRPDYAADNLLRGRFVILLDGSPMCLLAPMNLAAILKSPEDAQYPYYYVSAERMLRFFGLLVALFLPGFWIAVTAYNFDQIPFPLLATISSVRIGLPLSGPMDFLLMLALFELFREAGMRLPKAVGQTVAVVGGLIIGDAAIRAGITGPATLVITAISTMSMFTLINQSLAGTVTVLRIIILIVSMFLGMFGFMLTIAGLALYLATLESFGVPYLAPLSPPKFRDYLFAFLQKPFKLTNRRPSFLKTQDGTRKGDDTA